MHRRGRAGQGHAARLVRAVLAEIGGAGCRLNAQAHLKDMYGKLGFVVSGDEFLEDEIPRTYDVGGRKWLAPQPDTR